jgi:hypothetical protein
LDSSPSRIEVPLESALAAWWRVSKWRFSIDYAGSFDGFSHGSLNESYILQRGETAIDDPEFFSQSFAFAGSETDLVCDREGARTVYTGFGSSPSGGFRYDFVLMDGINPVRAIASSDQLSFVCAFTMSTVLAGGSLGSNVVSGANLTNVGTFTFSVLNSDFTRPINLIRNRPELGPASYFCNAAIQAHEYWPYDPGDGGGPIYDKDTGAQLRAFPE